MEGRKEGREGDAIESVAGGVVRMQLVHSRGPGMFRVVGFSIVVSIFYIFFLGLGWGAE